MFFNSYIFVNERKHSCDTLKVRQNSSSSHYNRSFLASMKKVQVNLIQAKYHLHSNFRAKVQEMYSFVVSLTRRDRMQVYPNIKGWFSERKVWLRVLCKQKYERRISRLKIIMYEIRLDPICIQASGVYYFYKSSHKPKCPFYTVANISVVSRLHAQQDLHYFLTAIDNALWPGKSDHRSLFRRCLTAKSKTSPGYPPHLWIIFGINCSGVCRKTSLPGINELGDNLSVRLLVWRKACRISRIGHKLSE